ncbi:hypothetical protein DNTS_002247 [Danionella cerebrum]|nr:hypothetical protein DNTS_002247 [Danionella translucida]
MLAGTAVAMLISTVTDEQRASSAAWSLLQISKAEPWRLTIGDLRVDCHSRCQDGVDILAVCRGLLTCCTNKALVRSHGNHKMCLLLDGLFPLISRLCGEKLDYHYYIFQVFSIWMKRLKECLGELWEVTSAPLNADLRVDLVEIIWSRAESPLDGIAEVARNAFSVFMEIYEKDCLHFGNTEKGLYVELLNRISKLPWESKAKYLPLVAILPHTGTHKVLELYPTLPSHILKCLSTNHLSPSASDVYRCLLQQQRQELIVCATSEALPSEQDMANHWAQRWLTLVLEALTSESPLLQTNASTHLLPSTLRTFPAAFDTLLSALDLEAPSHLHAWACVMSAQRASSGHSLWGAERPHTFRTLHLALSCLDESVRLAALNLLCSSPKTREAPSEMEYSALRDVIPFNLNSESSPFRQHLQAAIRKFLVRVRDSCMGSIKDLRCKQRLKKEKMAVLEQGVDFVDWLFHLSLVHLTPNSSYQRKKTILLLLSALLETCTDTWSPDRKKGQPPANISTLINWAEERGKWDFFSKSKTLVLIGCLEDSTNEIGELSAELLLRFFPPSFPDDVAAVLFNRADTLLQSPRVQQAQMGALMIKVLLQKADGGFEQGEKQPVKLITHLLSKLEQHYLAARSDMLLAARTAPIHGVVSALHRGLLEVPGVLLKATTRNFSGRIVCLLEKLTLLLLGVLYGDQDNEVKDVPPSFCDMGNAISSLIGRGGIDGAGFEEDGEVNVLLSEEHSLVLTCCWVSLKEIGIFLGSLVERVLSLRCEEQILTLEDLMRSSKVFKDIILKCRHWGAVEGCCIGFTRFCRALLSSSDSEIREIPSLLLQQGLSVLQSPRSTSVTRRAAGLPMLILGVLAAEESSKSRPLLAYTIKKLVDTARALLPPDWDQTLDLPQVCAVHTLQTLVKGSSLGVAVLQFTPEVAILSLTLLSSPCWAMRNAALQLYSTLCTRMLGQQPAGEHGSHHSGVSSPSFFNLYPALKPFLLEALEGAANDLHDAILHLHPSLYPVLTLLAKLQPGDEDQTRALSVFLPPLFLLSASPVYGVRLMSSKALVAMIPTCEYLATVQKLVEELPASPHVVHRHNQLHGQLLQIGAVLDRVIKNAISRSSLGEVVKEFESRLWLVSSNQPCPLIRLAYVNVVGSASFHQKAVKFLSEDPVWVSHAWQCLANGSEVVRLSLVKSVTEGRGWRGTYQWKIVESAMWDGLRRALLDQNLNYRIAFFTALVEVMTPEEEGLARSPHLPIKSQEAELQGCVEILLTDLESDRGGPVLISAALCAVSLLLSQSSGLVRKRCFYIQVNRALLLLLDLLLEEFWDAPASLEALVCHIPDCDLNAILKEVKKTEYNLLPQLLRLVKRYPESSILAKNLEHWAFNTAAVVTENLSSCMRLRLTGDAVNTDWLRLLVEPRFHSAVAGLFTRAIVLLQLLAECESIRHLLNPESLSADLQDLHKWFVLRGVFLPQGFVDALGKANSISEVKRV